MREAADHTADDQWRRRESHQRSDRFKLYYWFSKNRDDVNVANTE